MKPAADAALIDRAQARYPAASRDDLPVLAADLPAGLLTGGPTLGRIEMLGLVWSRMRTSATAAVLTLGVQGAAAFLVICLLGEGPLYRLLGFAVARADGTRVSRRRKIARAAVTWGRP